MSTSILLVQQKTRETTFWSCTNRSVTNFAWTGVLHLQQINMIANEACNIANNVHLKCLLHLNSPLNISATFPVYSAGNNSHNLRNAANESFRQGLQITTLYIVMLIYFHNRLVTFSDTVHKSHTCKRQRLFQKRNSRILNIRYIYTNTAGTKLPHQISFGWSNHVWDGQGM
jgi:hypothetical protein